MLAGFVVLVRNARLLQLARRRKSALRSPLFHPKAPRSAPTGGSSYLASRGGCMRLLLRPRKPAGEDAGPWSSHLTEGRPIAGVLAEGRLATSLASACSGSGWTTGSPFLRSNTPVGGLRFGALTPPSNSHTTRQPKLMSLYDPHLPETAGSAAILI